MSDSQDSARDPTGKSPARRRAHWTSHFIRFRFVGFLVILGVFGWVMFPNPIKQRMTFHAEQEQQRRSIFNSVKIARALLKFQKTRGTEAQPYPADLRELDALGGTERIGTLLAVKREFAGDWLYFPNADPKAFHAPLLISPPLAISRPGIKGQVVMSVDGSIQLMTAEEVEKRIETSPVPPVRMPAPVE